MSPFYCYVALYFEKKEAVRVIQPILVHYHYSL